MNPYVEQTILNADPIDLVRIMYQQAISLVLEARDHLGHKRIAKRSTAITKAYAVLAELLFALRHEASPELSRRLQSLYVYMQQRLIDANMQQADPPLAEVLKLLMTLEDAWSGAATELAPKQSTSHKEVPGDMVTHRWAQSAQPSPIAARHAVNA